MDSSRGSKSTKASVRCRRRRWVACVDEQCWCLKYLACACTTLRHARQPTKPHPQKSSSKSSAQDRTRNLDYLNSLTGIKFIELKLLRDGAQIRRSAAAPEHRLAVKSFAAVLWMRLDYWYARRPRLRLLVHQFFYNVFEEKQPEVMQSGTYQFSFTQTKKHSLANVYWREMTRVGVQQKTGFVWAC